jgi:hypothetical protein
MAGLAQTLERLNQSWRRAVSAWESAQAQWDDRVRAGFERDYWAPLLGQVQRTQVQMDSLRGLVDRARRDVR